MSVSYWMVEGIGIDVSKLEPFLDKKKLCHLIDEQYPGDEELQDIIKREAYEEFDHDDFLYGNLFDSLADIFTHCDDTDTLTWADDGDGGEYFYYPPSMPWHRRENEPDSLEEVHRRLIAAVSRITNLSEQHIENMIDDDIYAVGIG